jgi:hypothetical protein
VLSEKTRERMAELARHQLQEAIRHRRPTDPTTIKTTTIGTPGRRLRRLSARQNHEANQALQAFWRSQIERYTS